MSKIAQIQPLQTELFFIFLLFKASGKLYDAFTSYLFAFTFSLKEAFTLIELIVVIAIIGVLVAILVPTMNGFVQQANESTALANARTVYSVGQAEIAFAMAGGTGAPADAAALAALVDPQLGNMDGSYKLNYAGGVLTDVTFTMADGNTSATYPVPAA